MITAGIYDRGNGFRVSLRSSNLKPLMSALGQKRTLRLVQTMSALPPIADTVEHDHDVCPQFLSVELIVQPDAHGVVGEMGVRVNSSLTPLIRLS